MDNDSPASRGTFWTVWYYITEAVSRFFRHEPTNIIRNDPNSFQESVVDSEPANCGPEEGDANGREVDEEQPLSTVSVLSSSQPVVSWELCTTGIDVGPDEESTQYKTKLNRGSESKASDKSEGTREQFAHTRNDDAGLVAKDAKQDKHEENGVRGRDQTQEDDEYEEHVSSRSLRLTGDAASEESGRKAGAEEETERTRTPDDQKMDEIMTKIKVSEEDDNVQYEDEQDLKAKGIEAQLCTIAALSREQEGDNMHVEEVDTVVTHEEVENSDGVLLLASENENKSDEGVRQVENQLLVCEDLAKGDPSFNSLHAELQMACDKSGIGQAPVMAQRSESEKVLDAKKDESTLDEREQGDVPEEESVNEAANNQTTDEVQEVTEETQNISTGHVACSKELGQNAKTELQTVDFTGGEQKDVTDYTEVQTETIVTDDVEIECHGEVIDGKSDMATTDILMEIACTTTSVTVKTEGETGQEISREFKNIPLGIGEGRLVVLQELNSPTCEETEEGVPEYNNEPGPDENTTQKFLEVRDCEEVQTTQLPEEVESKDPESLENSGCSTGADYSLAREHKEEGQDSSRDIKNSFDLVAEERAEIPQLSDLVFPQEKETQLIEPVIQESGLSLEEEEGILLENSMKTAIEHSEKEFEMHVGLTDETEKPTKELQDGTEDLLVEVETDEGLCDFKEADAVAEEVVRFAEVQKMTESVYDINSMQNSYRTPSLLEDFTGSGLLEQSVETELNLLEVNTVYMQHAGINIQKTGFRVEEEAEEDDMQYKNEMEILNQQVAGMAAELTTEREEEENNLIEEFESLETQNQLSDKALEISNEETEAADESMTRESKPKDMSVIPAEEMAKHVTESVGSPTGGTVSPISVSQDVIDEEILDLWIQTALSEDTDGMKHQEGLEPGQQMYSEIEPLNEELDEISPAQTVKDKEQLVEINSGESDLLSDTEMSSTAESGFLDQSPCEWGPLNSETQVLTINTGSLQGIYDMLANMSESADISELSTRQPHSESEDILMEETAEARQSYLKEEESVAEIGFHPNSGVASSEARHLNQETDKSQETTDKETGSKQEIDVKVTDLARKTDGEDTEEAVFEVEETKVEHEPLEMTLSDSPDEIKHVESGRSRSGSEASSEEGAASAESGSHGEPCTESEKKLLKDKPKRRWSEDIADSLPELNKAEVAEQPTTESEDRMEVDASMLDVTAQRSRIAVRNPHVRPPKDPRSLLHMPSVEPTPSSHLSVQIPAAVPLGGLGIGIKLPGLGAGFPILKKTQRLVGDENGQETLSQEPATKPEEKSDTPKQDEAQHKPKWMPPRHSGFGNPLMSELKTKLKKTTKDDEL